MSQRRLNTSIAQEFATSLAQEAETHQEGGPGLVGSQDQYHRDAPDQDTAHPEGTAQGCLGTGPGMRPGQPASLAGAPCSQQAPSSWTSPSIPHVMRIRTTTIRPSPCRRD